MQNRYPNKEIASLKFENNFLCRRIEEKNEKIADLKNDILSLLRSNSVVFILCCAIFLAFLIGTFLGQWIATWPLGV
jgi:hypothetical protein